MEYKFKPGETTPWSWRQMLAALSPKVKESVLGSELVLGVVRIICQPVLGSYDHKRWHVALHLGRPYGEDALVPVWDFVITRTDGTMVRFHTNYSNNKVEVAKVCATKELPKPPRKGKGRSDGRGTYRRIAEGNYDQSVRSSQGNHGGGGDASAVAEPRLGEGATAPPPGLQESEPDRSDGGQRGWTDGAWNGSDGQQTRWTHESWHGWQEWGSGWQDRGSWWPSQRFVREIDKSK